MIFRTGGRRTDQPLFQDGIAFGPPGLFARIQTNSLFIPQCKRAESDKRDSSGFEDQTPVTIINCGQPWENGLPLLSLPQGEVKQKHDPSRQCRTVPSKKPSSFCS